jgi:ABC-type bacteriocin/lantibiotic exporter with double-glycine peptidase domain
MSDQRLARRRMAGQPIDRRRGCRLLVPEVVQSSAMDCGPAALKCLLEGFGLPVSYDRLRESCQTEVDGTSIDTLEEVARRLGLDARQVMLPRDHLFQPEARALPALVAVVHPVGATHFLVVWRRHGPWVQIMDPAAGRAWMRVRELSERLYLHTLRVPAAAWRQWAGSADLLDVLAAHARSLRLGRDVWERLLADALADPDWTAMAALDASLRMAEALRGAGGLRAGRQAAALVGRCFEHDRTGRGSQDDLQGRGSLDGRGDRAVPAAYWSVEPAPRGDADQPEALLLRGAVLLRVRGRRRAAAPQRSEAAGRLAATEQPTATPAEATDRPAPAETAEPPLPAGLRAAVSTPSAQAGREVARQLWSGGRLAATAAAAMLAVVSVAAAVESAFFRVLVDLPSRLALPRQRLGAAVALLVFLAAVLGLEVSLTAATLGLGRRLEMAFRLRLLRRVATLGDRYFRSRLVSDMAERCHNAYRLRMVPEVAANVLRNALQLGLTAACIAWLEPAVAWLAGLSAAMALGLSLAAQPVLQERDLRLRNHAGALGRYFLDALLGLVPARHHGAETALRREHEGLLVEWARAARRFERATLALDVLQAVTGYGLAVCLLFGHLRARPGHQDELLLLSYWALLMPILGQQLDVAARQIPLLRNTALRLLEPLAAGAAAGDAADPTDAADPADGVDPGDAAHAADAADRDGAADAADPAKAAAGRIEGAAEIAPDVTRISRRRGAAIRLEGVDVVAAGRGVLHDLNLALEPGAHLAIVGASGAGKSSLAGLLLGWHQPASGRVLVDGAELTPRRLAELRRDTAWVDPAVQLWNAPLLDNLLYGLEGAGDGRSAPGGVPEGRERRSSGAVRAVRAVGAAGAAAAVAAVGEAIDAALLRPLAQDLPQGLQTALGESGALVSGGEGQRIRLARGLLRRDARLVILDEPFRGLDGETRTALLRRARAWWRDATLLCITHDIEQTLSFDGVAVMDAGSLVELGSPRQLAADPRTRYSALLAREAEMRRRLRPGAGWRWLRLAGGRLVETTAKAAKIEDLGERVRRVESIDDPGGQRRHREASNEAIHS